MKLFRKIWIIFIILLLSLPAAGERYGGEFLNIAVGARAQGMGGAFGPVVDDPSAVYWNPAATSRQPGYQLFAGHTALFKGLANHDFIAVSGPVSTRLWLGLAWLRLAVDGIPRFSHTVGTPPEGQFSDNENALFLSAATGRRLAIAGRPFHLYGGGNVKLIYNRLDKNQATGIGLDAGLLAVANLADYLAPGDSLAVRRHPYWGTVSFSAVIYDIGGTAISWDTPRQHRDVRMAAFRFGASYRQPIAFMRSSLLASWEASTEPLQKTRAGAELELYRRLFLRAGSDNGQAVWGGGAAVWRMRLDYAFVGHDLGNSHRVSIAVKL